MNHSIQSSLRAFIRRKRSKKFANRCKGSPHGAPRIQFIVNGDQLGAAEQAVLGPIHHPGIGDDAVTGNPARRFQRVQDCDQLRRMLSFIHDRRSIPRAIGFQSK